MTELSKHSQRPKTGIVETPCPTCGARSGEPCRRVDARGYTKPGGYHAARRRAARRKREQALPAPSYDGDQARRIPVPLDEPDSLDEPLEVIGEVLLTSKAARKIGRISALFPVRFIHVSVHPPTEAGGEEFYTVTVLDQYFEMVNSVCVRVRENGWSNPSVARLKREQS